MEAIGHVELPGGDLAELPQQIGRDGHGACGSQPGACSHLSIDSTDTFGTQRKVMRRPHVSSHCELAVDIRGDGLGGEVFGRCETTITRCGRTIRGHRRTDRCPRGRVPSSSPTKCVRMFPMIGGGTRFGLLSLAIHHCRDHPFGGRTPFSPGQRPSLPNDSTVNSVVAFPTRCDQLPIATDRRSLCPFARRWSRIV